MLRADRQQLGDKLYTILRWSLCGIIFSGHECSLNVFIGKEERHNLYRLIRTVGVFFFFEYKVY